MSAALSSKPSCAAAARPRAQGAARSRPKDTPPRSAHRPPPLRCHDVGQRSQPCRARAHPCSQSRGVAGSCRPGRRKVRARASARSLCARLASLDRARHERASRACARRSLPAAPAASTHTRRLPARPQAGARLQRPLRQPLGPYPYPTLRTCSFRCTSHLNSGGTAAPGARSAPPLRGSDGCARPAAHATRHSNRPWCSRRSLSSPTCPRRSFQQPTTETACSACGKTHSPAAVGSALRSTCRGRAEPQVPAAAPPPPGLHSTVQRSSAGPSVDTKAAIQEQTCETPQHWPTKARGKKLHRASMPTFASKARTAIPHLLLSSGTSSTDREHALSAGRARA